MIAQKKRLDALIATQKTTAPNNNRFLKKWNKNLQKILFLTKMAKNCHFWRGYFIFSGTILCQEQGFFVLHSVHHYASFELSKTIFGQFLKLVIIRGFGGLKNLPNLGKKRLKKIPKFFSNQGAKRNKKMGGRSHVMTFGVFPYKKGTL